MRNLKILLILFIFITFSSCEINYETWDVDIEVHFIGGQKEVLTYTTQICEGTIPKLSMKTRRKNTACLKVMSCMGTEIIACDVRSYKYIRKTKIINNKN